ncbi:type IV secretory system conjugative DNA transfer family protein [Arthrobacter castelli]|uniref:type IV secretory system conjugative DNA transfer family protein n=1 Tax=Arthrobacter castelli TaxID=271431 RepID=UPI0004109C90|nr:type IV secretory system conjugative DNA transfer family protein [Arthrobacter castelli]
MAGSKRKARAPKADSWDKISARDPEQTLGHRDVHSSQQLDRSKRERLRSPTPGRVGAAVAGVFVTVAAWVLYSLIAMALVAAGSIIDGFGSGASGGSGGGDVGPYYAKTMQTVTGGDVAPCFRQLSDQGLPASDCYPTAEAVPVPGWYTAAKQQAQAGPASDAVAASPTDLSTMTVGPYLGAVSGFKLFLSLGLGLLVATITGAWSGKRVKKANLANDTADINQHENDQHIALPEEIQRKFDWFPDAGAHSSVQASSMISHAMLAKKGLKKIDVARRAEADTFDDNGNVLYYAGEALDDEDGKLITDRKPIIDEEFGEALFTASELPDDKDLRKRYDTTAIPYNADGRDRDRLGTYKRVNDLINDDWDFPDYEVQRPAGAYVVDTAPVNTMVLAITRAGKGQGYIEPMLDMWSREINPSNMVINDPKGELLVKNYIPFVTRGYEPVQFNLINSMKTDIYNPLGMAADAAREGDSTKCALYVENIADVFFPVDGSEDPVWPNAANNAFKRAAYGLIDFYLEEERELREQAARTGMDLETLEGNLDDMWGQVTLYNCYQLFVQLTSKKLKNPEAELDKRAKAGEFDDDQEGLEIERAAAAKQAFLWEGQPEQDMLTLYFNATDALPTNTMRTLIGNANNALRAMASAEKMLASVYGIAITAMSFFTDPTISTLTSGKPSQNTDLGGLSFPRRLGVRFSINFLKRNRLIGQQAVWSAYGDSMFTEPLGEDFDHSDIVSREGWARYYFKGKFPGEQAWLKLELVNPQSKMLMRTFYFHFKKNYQVSLGGRHYVIEPVTGQKIVKNGVLRELKAVRADDQADGQADGAITSYRPADTTYPQDRLDLSQSGVPEKVTGDARAITQLMVRYSEAPKAVFLVTPPHLMKYAKLVLILVKQLVDLNFDKSYMTKSNQKPLYKTRFMLDELGNLQSDGHGIANFETMLSVGLGQEQQFTLILQTLQQLRNVYGEDTDRIVQGNVSNIIYLKSTDDSMIETLEKMSGTTHVSHINSKQISQDLDKVVGGTAEGHVSYTMSTEKEPVISYNDMAFIPPRNSIVFRAGDAPVWNRNETVMPMSWRLLKNTIKHPGHEYSLQTIPTLSSALDFDVRKNQPDFSKMLDKRMRQAIHAPDAKHTYQESYGYQDVDIARLDPDLYSDEVMELVQMKVNSEQNGDPHAPAEMDVDGGASMIFDEDQVVENIEAQAQAETRGATAAQRARLVYADSTISQDMLVQPDGTAKVKNLDGPIAEAYKSVMRDMHQDREHFSVGGDDELRSADGTRTYITPVRTAAYVDAARKLNDSAADENSRIYADEEITANDLQAVGTMKIHADFYLFLAAQPSWEPLAGGAFDRAMALEMHNA